MNVTENIPESSRHRTPREGKRGVWSRRTITAVCAVWVVACGWMPAPGQTAFAQDAPSSAAAVEAQDEAAPEDTTAVAPDVAETDSSYSIVRRGAHVARPGFAEGLYLGLRTGAASHIGGSEALSDLAVGPAFAAELGYQLWRPLAVALSYQHVSGIQPDLARHDRSTGHFSIRATLPTRRLSPYVQAGVHRVFAGSESDVGADLGLGVDWALSERLSIFPEFAFHLGPSERIDGSERNRGGGVGSFGVGMRLNLIRSSRPAEVHGILAPRRVIIGEPVRFTAETGDGGSKPVDYTWRIDGDVVQGNPVDYVFRMKGWFDVEVEASNRAGRRSAVATIRVQDPLPPPPLPDDQVAVPDPTRPVKIVTVYGPGSLRVGETANFRVRVEAGAAWPINYRWDMGDGTLTEGNNVAHRYESPGTYEISVRARNRKGSDSQTHYVRVLPKPVERLTADAGDGEEESGRAGESEGGERSARSSSDGEEAAPAAARAPSNSSLRGLMPIDWKRGGYTLMAATSSDHQSAEEAARSYRAQGLRTGIFVDEGLGSRVFRVIVGQFSTEQEAVSARQKLLNEGRKGAFLVITLPRRSSK